MGDPIPYDEKFDSNKMRETLSQLSMDDDLMLQYGSAKDPEVSEGQEAEVSEGQELPESEAPPPDPADEGFDLLGEENADDDLVITGDIELGESVVITEKAVAKEYERLYTKETLLEEAKKTGDQTLTDLVNKYSEIIDPVASWLKLTPQQLKNPVLDKYLRQRLYDRPWLIPIVRDVKRVYTKKMAGTWWGSRAGSKLATTKDGSDAVIAQIKQENGLANPGNEMQYMGSKYGYSPVDPTVSQTFITPDQDRQDYSIQVMRSGGVFQEKQEKQEKQKAVILESGRPVIRKAQGPVYKLVNVYDDEKSSRKQIIRIKHEIVSNSEPLEVIGFLRIPPTGKIDDVRIYIPPGVVWGGNVKEYTSLNEIEVPQQQATAIIFPQSGEDKEEILRLLAPDVNHILKENQRIIYNLGQIDALLDKYSIQFMDLDPASYTKLVSEIREFISKRKITQEEQRDRMRKYMSSVPSVQMPDVLKTLVTDQMLENPRLKDFYGVYTDYQTPKDTQLNRLAWIRQHPDNGELYYLLVVQQFWSRILKNVKRPDTMMKSRVDALTKEITESMVMADTATYDQLPTIEKPVIQRTPTGAIVLGPDNHYYPLPIYMKVITRDALSLQQREQTLKWNLAQGGKFLGLIETQVRICFNKNALLKTQKKENDARVIVKTKIDAHNLTTVNRELDDLLSQVNLSDKGAVAQLYRNLITEKGILGPNMQIINKTTGQKICCSHKKAEYFRQPVAPFLDARNICIWCHADLNDQFIFDDVEFDESGLVTRDSVEVDAQPQVTTATVNCKSYLDKNDKNRSYACLVLSNALKLLKLSSQEMLDIIELYAMIAEFSDLDTLAYYDQNPYYAQLVATKSDAEKTYVLATSTLEKYLLLLIVCHIRKPQGHVNVITKESIVLALDAIVKIKPMIVDPELVDLIKKRLMTPATDRQLTAIRKGKIEPAQVVVEGAINYMNNKWPIFEAVILKHTQVAQYIPEPESPKLVQERPPSPPPRDPQVVPETNAYRTAPEYYALQQSLRDRVEYLTLQRGVIFSNVIKDLIDQIKADDQLMNILHTALDFQLKNKFACYKSVMELINEDQGTKEHIWPILIDFYLNAMLGFNINPPTSLPIENQPSLTGLQVRQRLTNLKVDLEIKPTTNPKLEQIKALDQERRVLEQRLSDLKPVPRVISRDQYSHVVSHSADYKYQLFDDSDKPTSKIICECRSQLAVKDVNITKEQLSKLIETFVSELQQAVDLKDFDLTQKTQYDLDVITLIRDRYNHQWSDVAITDMTRRELQKFINIKEHIIRMYYNLLLQTVAQIQGGMLPKMLPADLIEQFDSLKNDLAGFTVSLNGTTIDQLLGMDYQRPAEAVTSSSLIDILAGEVAKSARPPAHSAEEVIRYIQYWLIYDLHKLFTNSGRTGKRFVAFFIETINRNHMINDTTEQEVDDLKNANSYEKYKEYKKSDAMMTRDVSVGNAEDNKFIQSQLRRAGLAGRFDIESGSMVVEKGAMAEKTVEGVEGEGPVETKAGVEEFLDGQVGAEDRID